MKGTPADWLLLELGQLDSFDSSYGRFLEPLPFRSAFVLDALPQNCLLGTANINILVCRT